jgi:hypothetical protein
MSFWKLQIMDFGLFVLIQLGVGGGIFRRSRKKEEFRNMKMKQVG